MGIICKWKFKINTTLDTFYGQFEKHTFRLKNLEQPSKQGFWQHKIIKFVRVLYYLHKVTEIIISLVFRY